jgi:hypothetical protein
MVHYPSLPPLPPPSNPHVELATSQQPPAPPHPHRTSRHKPSPIKTAPAAETAAQALEKQAQQTTEVASGPSSDASPIGQLTAGGDATNIQQRRDIEQLITNTENGLDKISRGLNTEEQKTAIQIRTFLTKAKQALIDNDLDGANTLATKAKVLLDELTKK